MAIAAVQNYLNLAFSLTSSNRSKTDVSYSLPDDLRKYEDVKIKSLQTQRHSVVGGSGTGVVTRIDGDDSLLFIFASHPISITAVNGQSLGSTLRTSCFCIGRDRPGAYGATATALTYQNNLHTPNYTSDSGGSTTTVEVLIVQMVLEA
jgi:hypothetical protein